jgi:hypothetical protein
MFRLVLRGLPLGLSFLSSLRADPAGAVVFVPKQLFIAGLAGAGYLVAPAVNPSISFRWKIR